VVLSNYGIPYIKHYLGCLPVNDMDKQCYDDIFIINMSPPISVNLHKTLRLKTNECITKVNISNEITTTYNGKQS